MWWFLLFQILGLIVLISLIYAFCRFKKRGFFSFIWEYFKGVFIAGCIVLLIIALICWKPLYNTTHCYFRGKSMKAETKYSWYFGECQVKTKSGSFVPLRTSRGLPDGGLGTGDDTLDETNY